jgi:hypothetical protein
MAKNTQDAEARSVGTSRSVQALGQIQDQLDGKHGPGQIKTGVNAPIERTKADDELLKVLEDENANRLA